MENVTLQLKKKKNMNRRVFFPSVFSNVSFLFLTKNLSFPPFSLLAGCAVVFVPFPLISAPRVTHISSTLVSSS